MPDLFTLGSVDSYACFVASEGISPGQPGQQIWGRLWGGGGASPTALGVLVPFTTELLERVMAPAALAFPYTVALFSDIEPFDEMASPNTEMELLKLTVPF